MITKDIFKAKAELERGGVIGFPTETVYGLAANAFNEKAISTIFKLKNRPFFNPLIVHVKSISCLNEIVEYIPADGLKLADAFWPGPLTLILKKKKCVSDLVTGSKPTVAVRIPNHPIALKLLNELDFPLAAPSANPFTSISPTSAEHVFRYFSNKIDVILDGGICERGIESTIVGFEKDTPIVYRNGTLPIDVLKKIVPSIELNASEQKNVAPGMFSRHYSPEKKLYFTDDVFSLINLFSDKKIGLILFNNSIKNDNVIMQQILSQKSDLNEAASNLYYSMHKLDTSDVDIIIAEKFPEEGLGVVINDRLKRASF
jgi:L-threonylcarbamoyladenylate synthase